MRDPVTVAIIQHSPVFLDLEASVTKAIRLTEETALKGARVVTFGETWLPGYPAWLDYCSVSRSGIMRRVRKSSRACARIA